MISIIIPTLNEEESIGRILKAVREAVDKTVSEVIIVDGGSSDNTIDIARGYNARVIQSEGRGRARQMNCGAREASGEILYFLHADTLPPSTFQEDIRQELEKGGRAGSFLLSFDAQHKALSLFAWFTRYDIDLFRFGDQSLFVKKELFEKVGGFNEELQVMEDQDLVRRLKNHAQFGIIKKKVITSARKYEQIGVFKLQFIFTIIVLLFYLGVPQEIITHFYRKTCTGKTY